MGSLDVTLTPPQLYMDRVRIHPCHLMRGVRISLVHILEVVMLLLRHKTPLRLDEAERDSGDKDKTKPNLGESGVCFTVRYLGTTVEFGVS